MSIQKMGAGGGSSSKFVGAGGMVPCKLCAGSRAEAIYNGPIFLGIKAGASQESTVVYHCRDCGVFWHDYALPKEHYESEEYRKWVDGASSIQDYYRLHDGAVLRKLDYTGTDIYRDKVVADVGCAGGSFLDFVRGAAKEVVGIEPSSIYQKGLREKGIPVYSYAHEAKPYWGKVDLAVSWDVIEHVEQPVSFLQDMSLLLKPGGRLIVGTPTEYPVLRELLGEVFDRFIFQANHPWIFSEQSLKLMCEKIGGLENICVEQKFRYGIGNALAWLQEQKPLGEVRYEFISETVSAVWQKELLEKGLGEYLLLTAVKAS